MWGSVLDPVCVLCPPLPPDPSPLWTAHPRAMQGATNTLASEAARLKEGLDGARGCVQCGGPLPTTIRTLLMSCTEARLSEHRPLNAAHASAVGHIKHPHPPPPPRACIPHTLGAAKARAKHRKSGRRKLRSCRADVFRSVEDGRSAKRVLSCEK